MKDKKLKEIDLVYENCDVHTLTPGMFGRLIVSGIKRSYWINCYQYKDGETKKDFDCESFGIFINKKAFKLKHPHNFGETLHTRLKKWKDITHIHLHFEDGSDEYITVPWEGEHAENELQQVMFRKDEIEIIIEHPQER